MFRKFSIIVGLGIAAFAIAETIVSGAIGRGTAVGQNGTRGRFSLDVRKTEDGKNTQVRGKFLFESAPLATSVNAAYIINSDDIRHVSVVGRNCEFSGPARMTRRVGTGTVTVNGTLTAIVQDNHNLISPSLAPDKIQFRFLSSNTASGLVEFNGSVRDGDIRVFRVTTNP